MCTLQLKLSPACKKKEGFCKKEKMEFVFFYFGKKSCSINWPKEIKNGGVRILKSDGLHKEVSIIYVHVYFLGTILMGTEW